MRADVYREMCRYAGPWLLEECPEAYRVGERTGQDIRVGIYVVESWRGEILYVGSARRPLSAFGVARRVREHLANRLKTAEWYAFTVIPLDEATPKHEVEKVEGVVGFDLRPTMGRRHPVAWLR